MYENAQKRIENVYNLGECPSSVPSSDCPSSVPSSVRRDHYLHGPRHKTLVPSGCFDFDRESCERGPHPMTRPGHWCDAKLPPWEFGCPYSSKDGPRARPSRGGRDVRFVQNVHYPARLIAKNISG